MIKILFLQSKLISRLVRGYRTMTKNAKDSISVSQQELVGLTSEIRLIGMVSLKC